MPSVRSQVEQVLTDAFGLHNVVRLSFTVEVGRPVLVETAFYLDEGRLEQLLTAFRPGSKAPERKARRKITL